MNYHIFPNYASKANSDDEAKKIIENKDGALALNYHRIRPTGIFENFIMMFSNSKELNTYSVTDKEFEKQIQWLKRHDANFLTLEEFINCKKKGKFPERAVFINFEDMDSTIKNEAEPILKKYDIPATGFVITGKTGEEDYHNLDLLNKEELKDLNDTGRWSFGSLTYNLHSNQDDRKKMLKKSNEEVTKDIKKSRKYLKEELGEDNPVIAYPYGMINEDKVEAIENSGMKYGFTLEDKPVTKKDSNYYIPRIVVSKDSFKRSISKWKGFKQ
ncbi:intercellular adhesin biosynthesis polysaccharide N-deacetylase [Staphylococcus massiliensis]|nr:intercellular adhesin biosynthesis polysaccharide N-deacetylase [Staphylococcus massiliensis]